MLKPTVTCLVTIAPHALTCPSLPAETRHPGHHPSHKTRGGPLLCHGTAQGGPAALHTAWVVQISMSASREMQTDCRRNSGPAYRTIVWTCLPGAVADTKAARRREACLSGRRCAPRPQLKPPVQKPRGASIGFKTVSNSDVSLTWICSDVRRICGYVDCSDRLAEAAAVA